MAGTVTEVEEAVRAVMAARCAADLFGDNEKRAEIRHRRLVRLLHPDAGNGGTADAMARLNALWDEMRGKAPATGATGTAGARRPRELARDSRYALLEEDGRWLVVDRRPGGSWQAPPDGVRTRLGSLAAMLDGTPVCMAAPEATLVIAQPDGGHAAARLSMPPALDGEGHVVMLGALGERLPGRRLHPRDAAWLLKRAIFLSGALSACGLGLPADAGEALGCVAVAVDTHMLVLLPHHGLRVAGSASGGMAYRVNPDGTLAVEDPPAEAACGRDAETLLSALLPLLADDPASRRLGAFMRGVAVDRVTPAGDLLRELDGLTHELFGPPAFHPMRLEA